jgi:predicted transcriptional regulator
MTRDERELAEVEGYLKAKGMTRKRLCEKLDFHESLLCKIFKGRHVPCLIFWVRVGEALRDFEDALTPVRFDGLARA